MKSETNDCYQCSYRRSVPGSAHSGCGNHQATVQGEPHGIMNGWFFWPFDYDPTWLVSCDGFINKNTEE